MNAQILTFQAVETLKPSQQVNLLIQLRNTGPSAWDQANVALSYVGEAFGNTRLIPLPHDVLVNGEVSIQIPLKAPGDKGIFSFKWQMFDLVNEVFFGAQTDTITVDVRRFRTMDYIPDHLRETDFYKMIAMLVDKVMAERHHSNLDRLSGFYDVKNPYFEREYLNEVLAPVLFETGELTGDSTDFMTLVGSGVYALKGTVPVLKFIFKRFGFDVEVADSMDINKEPGKYGVQPGDGLCHIIVRFQGQQVNIQTNPIFEKIIKAITAMVWVCVEYDFRILVEVEEQLITAALTPATAQTLQTRYSGLDFDFWKNFCPLLETFHVRTFRNPVGEENHPQFFRARDDTHPQRVIVGPSVFYEDWLVYEPILLATPPESKCRKLTNLDGFDRAILMIYEVEAYYIWDEDEDGDLILAGGDNTQGEWVYDDDGDAVPRNVSVGPDLWWESSAGDVVPKAL